MTTPQGQKRIQPDDAKAKELMIYIALRSEGDDNFGATKLNKLMFFSDFTCYLNSGESISGQNYVKREKGPMVEKFYEFRDKLQLSGEIAFRVQERYGHPQHRIFALREPDLSFFSAYEIDLVNRVLSKYWDKTAREISAESHQFSGWIYADHNEVIPYEVALVGTRKLTREEIEYGKTLKPLAAQALAA